MQPSIRDVQAQFGLSDQDLQVLKSALADSEPDTGTTAGFVAPSCARTPGLLNQIEQRLDSVL